MLYALANPLRCPHRRVGEPDLVMAPQKIPTPSKFRGKLTDTAGMDAEQSTAGQNKILEWVDSHDPLQFVDVLSNGYRSRETRSHVMRRAYREKRRRLERGEGNHPPDSWPVIIECPHSNQMILPILARQGPKFQSSNKFQADVPYSLERLYAQPFSQGFSGLGPETSHSCDHTSKARELGGYVNNISSRSSHQPISLCSATYSHSNADDPPTWTQRALRLLSVGPQNLLGAGRVDTFNTYHGFHGPKTDELVDFCRKSLFRIRFIC